MRRTVEQWLAPVGLAGVLCLGAPRITAAEDAAPKADLSSISLDENEARAPMPSGETAKLTLDVPLQRASARLLSEARPIAGAVVAVEARSGKILAWAETRTGSGAGSVLLSTSAPAASVFKIVTTVALLERAKVSPAREVCIHGGSMGIERKHLDPPRSGSAHCAKFSSALGHSRNAVYAQLATHFLMRDDLVDVAETIGFNRLVPFDERVLMGDLKVPYGDLDFARTAAGFLHSTLSPVGAAQLALTVAAGGRRVRMRIVEEAGDHRAPEKRELLERVMTEGTARRLTRMMEVTVHSGTSLDVFTDENDNHLLGNLRIAGKTGTLQPSSSDPTSSWFIGFAPSRNPRIVVAVLLQNGRVWRKKANEVARDVLRSYFAARSYRRVHDPFETR